MSLRLVDVHKRYVGGKRVLRGLSFSVERGQTYALIGPNGAGKSTTIKCIIGASRTDSGAISFEGRPIPELKERRGLAYLPEALVPPRTATMEEYLDAVAVLKDLPAADGRVRYRELSERLGLTGVLKKRIATFSKGMRKKVSLIQAFLGSSELMILDEPTSDLDPVARRCALTLIGERAAEGSAILLTSHILTDLERVCKRAGLLLGGAMTNEIDVAYYKRNRLSARIRLEAEVGDASVELELGGPKARLDGEYRLKDLVYDTVDLEDWYHDGLGGAGGKA
ncbi:MAG: ABC transporter ATP-binding protein [Spirochaetales bacterium]|nr:ABC transporter ATP-binding protein [Spirochaetales bacterium]